MGIRDFILKLAIVVGICICLIYLFRGIGEVQEKNAIRQHEIALKYIEKGYVKVQLREGSDIWLKYDSVKTREAERP